MWVLTSYLGQTSSEQAQWTGVDHLHPAVVVGEAVALKEQSTALTVVVVLPPQKLICFFGLELHIHVWSIKKFKFLDL